MDTFIAEPTHTRLHTLPVATEGQELERMDRPQNSSACAWYRPADVKDERRDKSESDNWMSGTRRLVRGACEGDLSSKLITFI